ncbi:MAG: hypothetical protein PHE03_08585 [Bacteroidales bacterium]|nr:hypothetical protein [Bacteroidales bacterium]MDD3892344.1 hypothetical protein [Bacteroidales bacterium]
MRGSKLIDKELKPQRNDRSRFKYMLDGEGKVKGGVDHHYATF